MTSLIAQTALTTWIFIVLMGHFLWEKPVLPLEFSVYVENWISNFSSTSRRASVSLEKFSAPLHFRQLSGVKGFSCLQDTQGTQKLGKVQSI